jgi:hypothetical protein
MSALMRTPSKVCTVSVSTYRGLRGMLEDFRCGSTDLDVDGVGSRTNESTRRAVRLHRLCRCTRSALSAVCAKTPWWKIEPRCKLEKEPLRANVESAIVSVHRKFGAKSYTLTRLTCTESWEPFVKKSGLFLSLSQRFTGMENEKNDLAVNLDFRIFSTRRRIEAANQVTL